MSITVKNDFDAFPSYLFWFANFLDDNTSTHSQTSFSAENPEKHEVTDVDK